MHKLYVGENPRKHDPKSGFFHEDDPEYSKKEVVFVGKTIPPNTHVKKCRNCNTAFGSKMKHKVYCGDLCSALYWRKIRKKNEATKRPVAHAQ